jgi:hypothetical protein
VPIEDEHGCRALQSHKVRELVSQPIAPGEDLGLGRVTKERVQHVVPIDEIDRLVHDDVLRPS